MSRRLILAAALAATMAAGSAFAPAASAGNVAWSVSIGGPGYVVSAGQPGWGPGYVGATIAGCGYDCYGPHYRPAVPAPVYAAPYYRAPAAYAVPVPVPYAVRVAAPVRYVAPVVVAPRVHRYRHGPRGVYVPAPVVVPYGRY